MNRRKFLQLSIAAGVAVAVPISLQHAVARHLPIIKADGIHDDTTGLQAALNGEPFVCDSGYVTLKGSHFLLQGGSYLVTKQLLIPALESVTFKDANFKIRIPEQRNVVGYERHSFLGFNSEWELDTDKFQNFRFKGDSDES